MAEDQYELQITVSLGASDDRELQAMQALSDVMIWFDNSRPTDVPQDQESQHRIARWFADRYGSVR